MPELQGQQLHRATGEVLAVHGTLIKQMAGHVEELRTVVIEGNGEPPIRARVRGIESSLEGLPEMEADLHSVKLWVEGQQKLEEASRQNAKKWRDRIGVKALDFLWKVALGAALFYLGLDILPFVKI